MTYFSENSPAMVELESMVDKVGVRNVVHALAHIAHAKVSHVESTWQDDALAAEWMRLARYLDRLHVPSCALDSSGE